MTAAPRTNETAPAFSDATPLTLSRFEDNPEDLVEVFIAAQDLPIPARTAPHNSSDPAAASVKAQIKPPTRTHVWDAEGTPLGHIDTPAFKGGYTPRSWAPSGSRLAHRSRVEAVRSLLWDHEVRTGTPFPRLDISHAA